MRPRGRVEANNEMRDKLIGSLQALPDVTLSLWKATELLCVYYNGKEIAHFQDIDEIDIRLTPAIIKQKGLTPPENSTSHPDRSKNSRWIVQSFQNEEDIVAVTELVEIAATLREK